MKLFELLKDVPHTLVQGTEETEVSALEYDSRKLTPGALFLCVTGFQSDGHDYIPAALEKGAAALVVEREVSVPQGVTVIKVADSRAALAHAAAAWFGHPADKLTLIGLTGTKGKTTTAHMIKAILEAAGHKTGMIGTLGAVIGDELLHTRNTTPESYELQSLFARMLAAGCTHVVMEASSQGFKLRRTEGITFDVGAFLNLSPDHIGEGEHKDFQEYLECKSMIFRQSRLGVVNIDDPHAAEVTKGAACPLVTVSMEKEADFRFSDLHPKRSAGFLGTAFTVSGRVNGELELNMPGRFNVENAMTAVAAATLVGVPLEAVARGLARVSVRGRTQLMPVPGHYTLLIDYAHNAVSMENLLTMLRQYHPKRLICLFGGGGNRSRLRRYDMGEMAGKYADLTVLTMDNPRFEEVEAINEDIKVGLARHNGKYISIPDRGEAIRYVMDHAQDGDIIALIGKGHEDYQEIRGVKHHFSEEEVVRDYLAEKDKQA